MLHSAFCSLWAAGGAEGGPPTPSGFQLLFLSSTRAQRATLTRSLQALPRFPPPGLPFESNQWCHPHPAGRPGSICKTKIEDPPFKSYAAGRPHTADSHQYSTAKTKWTKKQRATSPVPSLRVHSHSCSRKRPRWGRLETKHLGWFRGHSTAQAMQPRGWDMGSAGTAHPGQGHQSGPGAAWSAWSTSVSRTTCHCGLLPCHPCLQEDLLLFTSPNSTASSAHSQVADSFGQECGFLELYMPPRWPLPAHCSWPRASG